jgi:hypothetical protein
MGKCMLVLLACPPPQGNDIFEAKVLFLLFGDNLGIVLLGSQQINMMNSVNKYISKYIFFPACLASQGGSQ